MKKLINWGLIATITILSFSGFIAGQPIRADTSITAPTESLDSWMPDKGLQQDVLTRLISSGILPSGATIADITKDKAKSNKSYNMTITHPVSSLEGLQYLNGDYTIGDITFKDTDVLFPALSNLNLTGAYNRLSTEYDNNNFTDLSKTLAQIKAQLATRPDLGSLLSVWLGFTNQHFTDISSWYNFSQQYKNLSLYNNQAWGFKNNTAKDSAQLEINGDIVLNNPLYVFDSTGQRVPLTDPAAFTIDNHGVYDSSKNQIIWHNANPEKPLTVAWLKVMDDPSPIAAKNNQYITFSGTLTATTLGRPVTVNYVVDQGKTLGSTSITGNFGDSYKTEQKTFDGYTFEKVKGPTTGNIGSKDVVVTYYYTDNNKPVTPRPSPAPNTFPSPSQPSTPTATPIITPAPTSQPKTINATNIAVKGEAVYAIKHLNLYKAPTFDEHKKIASYVRKPRINRPMFVVTGYARSKTGALRYRVRDVNHLTKNKHLKGYITANTKYVLPVYYRSKHPLITVINPSGINAYRKVNLTGKVKNYRQGTVLKVVKLVNHNLTTRYVLSNGDYVTGNRKLVMADKHPQPIKIKARKAANIDTTINLTKKVHHIKKGQLLTVRRWLYTKPYSTTRVGSMRYQVSGGYVTADPSVFKVIRINR